MGKKCHDGGIKNNDIFFYCMGVFLDIQATFDSITPEHIKNALLKHGFPVDMVDWYYELLTHRNLEATYENSQQKWIFHKVIYAVPSS